MKTSKNFEKVASKVAEENAKFLPDIFVQVGDPHITELSSDELKDYDKDTKRYTITHGKTSIKAKLARGVAEGLDKYNVVLMKSTKEIKIQGQDPIAPGYQVWRLVAA